jgi:hypothetical protein
VTIPLKATGLRETHAEEEGANALRFCGISFPCRSFSSDITSSDEGIKVASHLNTSAYLDKSSKQWKQQGSYQAQGAGSFK